jgi:hypothetical protein
MAQKANLTPVDKYESDRREAEKLDLEKRARLEAGFLVWKNRCGYLRACRQDMTRYAGFIISTEMRLLRSCGQSCGTVELFTVSPCFYCLAQTAWTRSAAPLKRFPKCRSGFRCCRSACWISCTAAGFEPGFSSLPQDRTVSWTCY